MGITEYERMLERLDDLEGRMAGQERLNAVQDERLAHGARTFSTLGQKTWLDRLLSGLGVVGVAGLLIAAVTLRERVAQSRNEVAQVQTDQAAMKTVQAAQAQDLGAIKREQTRQGVQLDKIDTKLDAIRAGARGKVR